MNKYELGIILKPNLSNEEKAEQIEKIKAFITKVEGVVTNVEDWGKRILAYEIKKVRDGYYAFIKFTSTADAIAKIDNDCRLLDSVMRHIIVTDEVVEQNPKKKIIRKPRTDFKKNFGKRDNKGFDRNANRNNSDRNQKRETAVVTEK